MKKYFYSDEAISFGPFTLEELREKRITRETYVWFEELGEWEKAGEIPELNDLFAIIPPFPQQTNYNRQLSEQTGSNNTIDMFVFLSIFYWFITDLANYLTRNVGDYWYYSHVKYLLTGMNMIFALIPVVITLSIRNKKMRITAIIFSICICLYRFYSTIYSYIQYEKIFSH